MSDGNGSSDAPDADPQALAARALVEDPASLVEVLAARARATPDKRALVFLADGEEESGSLTYGEIDRRARALASVLQSEGLCGERALLFYQPGLEFVEAFIACLYAGAVAVPAYPPRPGKRSYERVGTIVAGARCAAALVTAASVDAIRDRVSGMAAFDPLRWIATDEVSPGGTERWSSPKGGRGSVAYLQYTSGSTSAPKGVMVTHSSLLHNMQAICDRLAFAEDCVQVSWLPQFHDMGLIAGILRPLYAGGLSVLMPPIAFTHKPVRWLRVVTRWRGTHSGCPNFGFDHCVRSVRDDDLAELDLSSWRVAANGAEPVRMATMERFTEKFEPYGFRNEAFCPGYGLAEATLTLTCVPPGVAPRAISLSATDLARDIATRVDDGTPEARDFVSCGKAVDGVEVTIAELSSGRPCLPEEIGEIWASGPSVTGGYWGEREVTQATFGAVLDDGRGPFLKTGDLGCLVDGELFVTGRLQDLIIIRGANHYPQDIELTAEHSHPALRPGGGAAFSTDGPDGEILVVVHEVKRSHHKDDPDEVATAVRKAVAQDHELTVAIVVLLKPGYLPRTSSGKVRRRACRDDFLSGQLSTLAVVGLERPAGPGGPSRPPADGLEARLAGIWRDILGIAEVGADDDFFSLGGDSLAAARMFARIGQETGADLPLATLFDAPTIEKLARLVERSGESTEWASLVAIRSAGSLPPVFCIPGRGGDVLCFHGLTKHLGDDQPVYALRARGLDGLRPPHRSIEVMAQDYAEEIGRAWPSGPCQVAGHSGGGLVALEVALCLQERGRDVTLLAMLDTRHPQRLRKVARSHGIYWRAKRRIKLAARRFRFSVYAKLCRATGQPLPQHFRHRYVRTVSSVLLGRYRCRPWPGKIVFFRAETAKQGSAEHWEGVARDGLAVEPVPGNHSSIIEEPNVVELAARLRRHLAPVED